MAKIKLGAAPANFSHKILVTLLDGTKTDIKVEYVYRNRMQFAQFVADIYPEIKDPVAADSNASAGFDLVQSAAKAQSREVENILACVKSWDLSDELTEANVARLVSDYPAVATAIIKCYREAITEGRLGN